MNVDGFMKKIGMREASFCLTNKVDNVDQLKRYNMGLGFLESSFWGSWTNFSYKFSYPFYVILMNYPIVEGILIRKDWGRIPPSVTLLSAIVSLIF
ncbi:hypothetical protein Prudu_000198 [Prunus dulcis]|uniref:Uncharacterized protein n=1 Tax=Prunus dulcis TaxID=3755 RepID=A0A4Y1QKN2_PRUDU|nr:hypothetical protein Prudu_000198 [Prunus dulcis]